MLFRLRAAWLLTFILILVGCASPSKPGSNNPRSFDFHQDSFAYPNELVWKYDHAESLPLGAKSGATNSESAYTHHCFVVARSARLFFQFAQFDPVQAAADAATYRKLVRRVVSKNPRSPSTCEDQKVMVPGYAGLRGFSQAHEVLLKSECGGAWQSYFQRGHWRMIFPFSRAHQARMASQLIDSLQRGIPPVVHLVRFPQLTINHAVVLFDAIKMPNRVIFQAYDPNTPEKPILLTYDSAQRTFSYPQTAYFKGGKVNVYEIYHAWNY